MKKTLKKGFTLVELVIVIAVIAILSAVLIPTFGNVISNAKKSSAQSEASNAISQYITNQASAGQAADLPDGYIIVFKSKKELLGGTTFGLNDTNYAASEVEYVFPFQGGRVLDPEDGVTGTDVIAPTSDKYVYPKVGDTLATTLATNANTISVSGKSLNTFGIYFLDADITTAGTGTSETISSVSGKVVLIATF